jgi:hypothetical protein
MEQITSPTWGDPRAWTVIGFIAAQPLIKQTVRFEIAVLADRRAAIPKVLCG